jgi:hypothetical protein
MQGLLRIRLSLYKKDHCMRKAGSNFWKILPPGLKSVCSVEVIFCLTGVRKLFHIDKLTASQTRILNHNYVNDCIHRLAYLANIVQNLSLWTKGRRDSNKVTNWIFFFPVWISCLAFSIVLFFVCGWIGFEIIGQCTFLWVILYTSLQ